MTTKLNLKSSAATANKNLKTKTKRAFALLLMLALLAPATAWAQSFGGGSGTETDPYIISTVQHWQSLRNAVNNDGTTFRDQHFRLDADLDFSGIQMSGIGCENTTAPSGYNMFYGHFDGNGHTIRNFQNPTITVYSIGGLFAVAGAGALIENLTLDNCTLRGGNYSGGIVGYLNGNVAYTDRGVRNCIVAANCWVRKQGSDGLGVVGGIVGQTSGKSDVADCVFLGRLDGNNAGAITSSSWVHWVYQNGNTSVDPDQQSKRCLIGGNCTAGAIGVIGSTQGTDELTSAKHITTVSFANDINGSISTSPTFSYSGTHYYECGTAIDLSMTYTGTTATGYIVESFLVNGTPITKTENGYTTTLPSLVTNVNITAQPDQAVRDIAYEPWISITTPSQQWTGGTLTPVVTVTDSQNGSPVTLIEGTDYRLSPEGGFVNVGSHTITVIGIGNYGGQATTVFSITDPSFTEGSGTETDPFIIRTTEQMNQIAFLVNQGDNMNGVHFRLGNDLDYTNKTYTPIGAYYRPFCGTFDGYYNTIENITVTCSSNYQSLFYHLGQGGTIRNLTIDHSTIDCNNKGDIGGIVAWCKGGTIEQCTVTENVTISNGYEGIGGMVGRFDAGSISYCHNEATLSGSEYVGGIVGYMQPTNDCEILICTNSGSITAVYSFCGGIAGRIWNTNLSGCINTGAVAGKEGVGGIVGVAISSTITSNLNLASVSATNNNDLGGIAGAAIDANTFRNNYYAGACATTGGIDGEDVMGQAMKGWIVSTDEDNLFAQMFPINDETYDIVGITFGGIRYVGAGETTKLLIEKTLEAPEGIIAASAGILKPLDEEFYDSNDLFYLLTMPSVGGDVNLTIAEPTTLTVAGYGTGAGGYRFIASPVVCNVAAATVTNIFGASAYDLYRFDQSEELEWRNHKAQAFELENGKGYLYASNEDVNLVFRGTYNRATEPVEVPLTYNQNANFAGWNLVGNPFPVAAYADKSYYKMNAAGTAIEPVAVSSATPFEACTGVMVKAETTGETVTFSRTAQQSTGNNGTIQIAVAQADTRGNAIQDKAIVSFNAGDRLEKLVFGETDAKIYIPQGGKDYAVATVGRDAPWHVSTTDEIPINFKAAKNGTYTLTFETQNLDLEYLHLIDNLTGNDVDLLTPAGFPLYKGGQGGLNQPSYTFTAKTTDYASRFRLVFSEPADGLSANRPFAYIADGEIRFNEADACGASLQVVDVMGRVIVTKDVARNVSTNGMTPGVYVLRLIDGDNVRTQKIVID